MIEVRKVVSAYLKLLHPNIIIEGETKPRIFFEQAPTTAVFPYLVFDFQLYPDGEGGELVTLSINGWDNPVNGDTTVLETLMAKINGKSDSDGNPTGLDKMSLVTDEIAIAFYLENIIPIVDDDKSIRRRNYNYEGKLIRR